MIFTYILMRAWPIISTCTRTSGMFISHHLCRPLRSPRKAAAIHRRVDQAGMRRLCATIALVFGLLLQIAVGGSGYWLLRLCEGACTRSL